MGSYFGVDDAGHLTTTSIENTAIGSSSPSSSRFNSIQSRDHATFSSMDFGLESIGTVSYGSNTTVTVNIHGSGFSGAPNVVCTPTAGATSDANIAHVSCGIYNVSTSQFSINCTINDPNYSSIGSVYVAWFAFE